MDIVADTTMSLSEKLEDIEAATESIGNEVSDGQRKAEDIKSEAETVQAEAGKGFAVVAEEIGSLADNLNDIMNEMANAVNSISDSVRESSTAINMSAANSSEIVAEMQGIGIAMDNSNKVASQLSDSTKQFIKV